MLGESGFLKNKKIWVLLGLECLLLLLGIAGLFGRSGVVVDREDAGRLIEDGVSLPAGHYVLRLYYAGEGDNLGSFGVVTESDRHRTLLANEASVWEGDSVRECSFFLTDSVETCKAVFHLSENVEVQGLELHATNAGQRVFLFWVIAGCLLLNGILVICMYHRKHPIPMEKQVVGFGLPALMVFASLPAFVDYAIYGADLIFHMRRIETLADAIRLGELPVRMWSVWLGGHGYASSFFYGDTCLAVPAVLRLIGFTPDAAYRMFLVAVNLATAWVAYISFKGCFRNRYLGFFGSLLYTLAPYRMYNMYNRAAIGEATAMIFLPLLVWGFYRIYTEDPGKKGYLWNWVIPVIGFSGVIQSHALTCEMTGFFVIVLCLILWKKTFRRRTFMVLSCTVIMTVVINAWYLVPFLDLMFADQYYFGNNAGMLIQSRGVYPAQIFYTLQAGGSSSRYVENGMLEAEPIGLGVALLFCMFLWLVVRRYKCKETGDLIVQDKKKRAGDIVWILTVIALVMSTSWFPWDFLSHANKVLASLVGSIQFPTRITSVATVLGVFVACVTGEKVICSQWGKQKGWTGLGIIGAAAVLFGGYQLNDFLLTRDSFLRLYTPQNIGSAAVLGAEYLPLDADITHMRNHAPVLGNGVTLDGYEKKGLEVRGHVTTGEASYLELPLLYYKGYRAVEDTTGEGLTLIKGDNCDVRVLLPEDFSGQIHVWYAGMWYWHLAEAVSVIAGIGFLVYYGIRRRRISKIVCAATDSISESVKAGV